MNHDISPVSRSGAAGFQPAGPAYQAQAPSSAPSRSSDQVELSEASRLLSQLENGDDVRMDKVNQIKQEIANGTYETPEKVEAALRPLAEDLGIL